MNASVVDGWLVVPYDGSDRSRVRIGVGAADVERWIPAFLGWVGGCRVAQVRPPDPLPRRVWISVDGVVTDVGRCDG